MHFTQQGIGMFREDLIQHLSELNGRKVLIVGDVCLDDYIYGKVQRISPEAPVPVLEVNRQESRLGLSANVAANVKSLGGEPLLLGVIGDDEKGVQLKKKMEEEGVSSSFLILDAHRPTTCKTRVMTGNHHIVRVDYEKKKFLSEEVEQQLFAKFDDLLNQADIVIIEDYAKGVLSEKGIQYIIKKAKGAGKRVTVDPYRTTPPHYYKGADLFKPNRDEGYILSGLNLDELRETEDSVYEVAQALFQKVECSHLVMTLGKEGLAFFKSRTEGLRIPTFARQVFDVTGAGDTFIATLSLAWSAGWTLEKACMLANVAASEVVGIVGCASCSQEDLKKALMKI